MVKITAHIGKPPTIKEKITGRDAIAAGFGTVVVNHTEGERYTGNYEITPKVDETQTLQTRNKVMSDDVTIFQIPFFQTSNLYGDTIYIGSEVELNGN